MNDIIIKTLWTSVAAIIYISQLVSQKAEYVDIFSTATNETATNQDRRPDPTGQPDGTSTGTPPGPIWWPSRGEENLTHHLLLESAKLLVIAILSFVGYYISNRIKNRVSDHSVEVKVKVENDFKTEGREGRTQEMDPRVYSRCLEKENQMLREEVARAQMMAQTTVQQFEANYEQSPEAEVDAPNNPNKKFKYSKRGPIPVPRRRRANTWTVTASAPSDSSGEVESIEEETPPPPYEEQRVVYEVDGVQMNEQQYIDHRLRRERELRRQEELRQRNVGQNSEPNITQQNAILDPTQRLLNIVELVLQNQNQQQSVQPKPTADRQVVPDFDGDKKLAFNWFREFNRVADGNAWNDAIKVKTVPGHLKGRAQTWFYAINRPSLTWPDFEYAFKRAYLPDEMKYSFLMEMNNAIQRDDESGLDYVYRVLELKQRVDIVVPDQQIIQILIKGFKYRIYKQMVSINGHTIEEVLELVKSLDMTEDTPRRFTNNRFTNASNNNSNAGQTTAGTVAAQSSEQTNKIPEKPESNAIKSGPRKDFVFLCANCGTEGHKHTECPLPRDAKRVRKFFDDRNASKKDNSESTQSPPNVNTNSNTVNQTSQPAEPVYVVDSTTGEHSVIDTATNLVGKQIVKELRHNQVRKIVAEPIPEKEQQKTEPKLREVMPEKNERKVVKESQSIKVNLYTSSPDWPILRNGCPIRPDEDIVPIPTAKVNVEGYVVRAVFDTGSNKSAINHNFKKLLNNTTEKWNYGVCRNFDGSQHTPGELIKEVCVRFNTREVKVDMMVIENLSPDIILGMDYILLSNIDILPHILHITTRDDANYEYFRYQNQKLAKHTYGHSIKIKPEYYNWLTTLTGDVINEVGRSLEDAGSRTIDWKRKRLALSLYHYKSDNQFKKEKWMKKLRESQRPEEPISTESEDSSFAEFPTETFDCETDLHNYQAIKAYARQPTPLMPGVPKEVEVELRTDADEGVEYVITSNPVYEFLSTPKESIYPKNKNLSVKLVNNLDRPFILERNSVPVIVRMVDDLTTSERTDTEQVVTAFMDANNNELDSDESDREQRAGHRDEVHEIMQNLIEQQHEYHSQYIEDLVDAWYNREPWHQCPNCGGHGHQVEDCPQEFDVVRVGQHMHRLALQRRAQMNALERAELQNQNMAEGEDQLLGATASTSQTYNYPQPEFIDSDDEYFDEVMENILNNGNDPDPEEVAFQYEWTHRQERTFNPCPNCLEPGHNAGQCPLDFDPDRVDRYYINI